VRRRASESSRSPPSESVRFEGGFIRWAAGSMTLRSSDEVPGRCQITVVSCKTLGVAGTQGRPLQVVVRCNAYLDHLGQLRRKAVKVLFVRFDGEPLDLVACCNRFEEHAPGELGLAGLLESIPYGSSWNAPLSPLG